MREPASFTKLRAAVTAKICAARVAYAPTKPPVPEERAANCLPLALAVCAAPRIYFLAFLDDTAVPSIAFLSWRWLTAIFLVVPLSSTTTSTITLRLAT